VIDRNDIIERRKHKRFRAKKGAFAVLKTDYNLLGQIVDISKGGLSYRYSGHAALSEDSVEVEIFSIDNDFYMKKLPVKTVSDFKVDTTIFYDSLPMRQLSVEFGKMNPNQTLLLDYFLSKYTFK